MSSIIKPSKDYLVLSVDALAPQKEWDSPNGFILKPASKTEKPSQAKIIIVNEASSYKVWDTAIFKQYTAENIEIDGTDYLFLRESDVIAIVCDGSVASRLNDETIRIYTWE